MRGNDLLSDREELLVFFHEHSEASKETLDEREVKIMHQVFESLWSLEIRITATSDIHPLTYRGKYSVPIVVVHAQTRPLNSGQRVEPLTR